jgi:ABC-type nitrate/sulfonate/bicarbonate transport system substrate-binding protein
MFTMLASSTAAFRSDQGTVLSSAFTFYLDWIASAQFAGLYWAKVLGFYESAGLNLTLVPWQNDSPSVFDRVAEAALRGELSAGCAEDNLIVRHASANGSMLAFGAMLQETPLVLMSRPERAIRSIADLRGKRVAMHEDGVRVLEMILALERIPVDEVDLHVVGFDLDHLSQGRCDALQGYCMTEPIQLAASGFAVDLLQVKHPKLHPSAQVYFGEQKALKSHAHIFSAFLDASSAGWRSVCANPEEAARLLADVLGDASREAEQFQMLERVIPLVNGTVTDREIGAIDRNQWERNIATYRQFGLIDRHLELNDVVLTLRRQPAARPGRAQHWPRSRQGPD